ncbi:MAG: 50S ribosomal protein L11 methyltransferase [Thermodesulfovibrionales bacterium]|jgi:ribosomal protein L11 methyltransferase
MGYYEFTITASDESRDAITNKMSEMGCLGSFERNGTMIAYFPDRYDIITLRDGLQSFRTTLKEAGLNPEISFDYVFLSERDWNESWKKRFRPIDVGEKFSIAPPWEKNITGRITLLIDPGMAFGTGHHETTRRCLMLIEKFSRENENKRFLDVGTGTGILAIGAAQLGYLSAVGTDTDPLAVDAAKRNVRLNSLDNVEIREGSISDEEGTFDVIVANLMSEVLIDIAPQIESHLNASGLAILSGMLVGQEDDVIEAMDNAGLRPKEQFVDDRWVSLVIAHGR